MPRKIEHFIVMGDSLSDRGTMDHRKLFNIIPMKGLSGLDESPLGRFGNGLVWDDDLALKIYADDEKAYQKAKSDAVAKGAVVVNHDDVDSPSDLINEGVVRNYNEVLIHNQDIFRTYNEGGLTSYNWKKQLTADISVDVKAQILSNLEQKRELLLEDDKARGITESHKQKTLVIEWSGANDLITIHDDIYKPDGLKAAKKQADEAIDARIRNIKALMKNGYQEFVLFNLPDLSLTPRFQNPDYLKKYVDNPKHYDQVRENAHELSLYFNKQLAERIGALNTQITEDCAVSVFDVNETFSHAYENPEEYGLNSKVKTRGVSIDFPKIPDEVNAAVEDKYMFWDEVHPTAAVHQILAEKFYAKYEKKYDFTAPHETLLDIFKETYGQKLENQKRDTFGDFRVSNIKYLSRYLKLEDVFYHALKNDGYRTHSVLVHLGWISTKGQLVSDHPSIVEAYNNVMNRQSNLHFDPTASELDRFKHAYLAKLSQDRNGFLGFFRSSRMDYKIAKLNLEEIFDHGLNNGGGRTRSIMVELGWINQKGALVSDDETLREAYQHAVAPIAPSM